MQWIYFQANVQCEEAWKKTLAKGKQGKNFHDKLY